MYSVKAVFIYTRASVFLLCIITRFLMYRHYEPFFLPLVKSQLGWVCVWTDGGSGDGCPPLLDSASSEPGAPWVWLIDGATIALTEKDNSSEGMWGDETQQCRRGNFADHNVKPHVSPSLSLSCSLGFACLRFS